MMWIEYILVMVVIALLLVGTWRKHAASRKQHTQFRNTMGAQRYDAMAEQKPTANMSIDPLPEEGGRVHTQVKKKVKHTATPKTQPTADAERKEAAETPVVDFTDAEEVRKAIIASEILNKKY